MGQRNSDRQPAYDKNSDDGFVYSDFCMDCLVFLVKHFRFLEFAEKKDVPGIFWVSEATPIKARTAILMPVYNESPTGTFANLTAIAKDLENIGHEKILISLS